MRPGAPEASPFDLRWGCLDFHIRPKPLRPLSQQERRRFSILPPPIGGFVYELDLALCKVRRPVRAGGERA